MTVNQNVERRRFERSPIEEKVMLVTMPGAVPKNHEAVMVDVSASGARIRTTVGLKPGQPVELVTAQNGVTPSQVRRSQVVWMSTTAGEAGLKFGEPVQMKNMSQSRVAMMR